MIGTLYGVYDRKAEHYVNVFVSSNDETAKRSFENLFFTIEDNVYNLCKNDFVLVKFVDLFDIPAFDGSSIPLTPSMIYLGADIPDYLIRDRREQSFINFMKAKASKISGEHNLYAVVSEHTSENPLSENENDTTGQKS